MHVRKQMTTVYSPALILIDWQDGFEDWDYWGGNRNNPDAEDKAATLLDHWRSKGQMVAHVIHHSLNPDSPLRLETPGGKIKDPVAPLASEEVFVKRINSGFIGTDLANQLRRARINDLVICGLTTNHCVSTTTRMAGNMGYDVQLVGEACATFDRLGPDGQQFPAELIHDTSLANLHGEFCEVIPLMAALSQAS